jgi:alpha-amylase
MTTTGSKSTKTVAATVKDVNGTVVTDRVVSWTSTPGSVATVSPSSGASTTVTGKSVGQAQVVATSETKTGTASIKVMLAVTSVTISPTAATLSLVLTPTAQLSAAARNGTTTITGRTITWTSDTPSVATVDATGKVTAKAVGIAHITATAAFDGVSSTPVTITVSP